MREALRPRLFWLVVAFYLLAFPYHPGLRSPNELCRLWQARALVDLGKVSLNETMRTYGPVGDLSVVNGVYYPSKAPLLSFLAAPVYAVLKGITPSGRAVDEVAQVFWSRLLLTVLPTLLLLVLLRRFLTAYVAEPVAEALTATYALGSLALSYSLLFMSHQTTAVLLFAAFYALWRRARGEWAPWRAYLVAGAASGAAVAAEYTGALGLLGLLLYAALDVLQPRASPSSVPGEATTPPLGQRLAALAKGAGWATLGALPFVLPLMAYHQAAFGHPWETGYKHLADAAYQPWHLGGFLGIRTPDPRAFALSLFSPLRGLFTLSPFLLLSLAGLPFLQLEAGDPQGPGDSPARRALARERTHLLWLTVALLLGYAYFTSSFSYESWGWTTGPRHLTPLVPFLVLPAALFLEHLRAQSSDESRVGLGLAAGLCMASVAITGLVSLVNYVPDDVSMPLFGLAVPLFRSGLWPPSALSLLGLPGPVAGAPLFLLLAGGVAWTGHVLVRHGRPSALRAVLPSAVASAVTLLSVAVLLLAFTRGDAKDLGAQAHLRGVWLTRAR